MRLRQIATVAKYIENAENELKDILGLKVNQDKQGVVIIDIDTKSQAYKSNLRKNDIITEIGKAKIDTIDDYLNELENYSKGDTIMIRIIKNGSPRYEAFEIK